MNVVFTDQQSIVEYTVFIPKEVGFVYTIGLLKSQRIALVNLKRSPSSSAYKQKTELVKEVWLLLVIILGFTNCPSVSLDTY